MKRYITQNIIRLMLFAGIFTGFFACTNLDDEVYSEIIADKYEYKEGDIVAILGKAYQPWRMIAYMWEMHDRWTDQQCLPQKYWGWGSENDHKHNFNPEASGYTGLASRWDNLYAGISTCNQLLEQLDAGVFSPENKDEMLAELRVIRASYYYYLCDLFGNVPIVEKFDVPTDYLPEQSTRTEVFNFVVKEVTESLPFLTDRMDKSTYGRFNRYAAYALLAKMYINAEVYTGTAKWQECINVCDSIILPGKYSLTATQKACFARNNDATGFSEAVFAIAFDETYARGLGLFSYTCNGQHGSLIYGITGGWGNGGDVMIPQFISTYDGDDLRLKNNYLYGQQWQATGAPLLAEFGTIKGEQMVIDNFVASIKGDGSNCTENMGYRCAKFEFYKGIDAYAMDNDVFLFRYTDVLMMKAECLLRTGRANEAASIVSDIRKRAFTATPAKAVVTGNMLQQGSCYDYGKREWTWNGRQQKWVENSDNTHEGGSDIVFGRFLDELGWEFDQEGHRRQDLIRFKTTSGESVWTAKGWLSHFATHNKNKELYPIPATQILNNPKLNQNPGYAVSSN
ncbi:MAG: RagB/SusD family nutrient uptake outer membrane protein [Dysgonamonadaceae bacterium]|nr:RagB/SusD family nutrient uptake outer membrane protein [Dysgonamonadaceae bacterium]